MWENRDDLSRRGEIYFLFHSHQKTEGEGESGQKIEIKNKKEKYEKPSFKIIKS